ncbi:MAG: hypothetical protein ACT7A5_20860, partial [Ferrovibrionaceae bacterium]
LKHRRDFALCERHETLRGGNASASLKLAEVLRGILLQLPLRGGNASASLKQVLVELEEPGDRATSPRRKRLGLIEASVRAR